MPETRKSMRRIAQYSRIIIKVGTNVLMKGDTLNVPLLRSLSSQIVKIKQQNRKIILITSGAVGLGAHALNFSFPVVDMHQRQACAAIGQPLLMHHYREAFQRHKQPIGQVLLTREILRNQRRFLNLQNTINTLLADNVLPICNENDSVATDELDEKIGDNDLLGALLARNFHADLYIILTDTEGLYANKPQESVRHAPIPIIHAITPSLLATTTAESSGFSTGGMQSKLQAIKLATLANCNALIAAGYAPRILPRIFAGEQVGTFFPRREKNKK